MKSAADVGQRVVERDVQQLLGNRGQDAVDALRGREVLVAARGDAVERRRDPIAVVDRRGPDRPPNLEGRARLAAERRRRRFLQRGLLFRGRLRGLRGRLRGRGILLLLHGGLLGRRRAALLALRAAPRGAAALGREAARRFVEVRADVAALAARGPPERLEVERRAARGLEDERAPRHGMLHLRRLLVDADEDADVEVHGQRQHGHDVALVARRRGLERV
mmetsp:Transcript_11824/g.35585  ORF Transcript_11824/g.35585 Transcript_11824/m.35585 type:complete len:221 (+) Transcript_11824:379-1041(+)